MSDGKTPPLQDPGGIHGYKGMSSQLHDTGGLHVYNMNGGSHKLTEIVPQSPVAMTINNPVGGDMGLFPETSLASGYQLDGGMQGTPYMDVEQLGFNDPARMYDDIKTHSPTHMQTYFGSLETVQNPNSLYDNGSTGYQTASDIFKTERDGLGGYIEMLGNPETLMNIKREKPDYTDHMGMGNNHAQDMNYATNNVADWNYYNSMPQGNNFPEVTSQSGYGTYNMQSGSSFNSGMIHGNQMIPQLQSNIDIHNQSKKITQNIIGAEWSTPMYKSRLYSNLDVDVSSRKRKNDVEPTSPKRSKPRRKKSNDLAGHSKTVASILMSDNSSGFKNGENVDASLLDSSGRNDLVTKLMDNLRTTVQFESFCLSFPRTDIKENAFRGKVNTTTKLVESLVNKSIYSESVPANYLTGATRLLSNFNMALENSRNKATNNDESSVSDDTSRSAEQVEEHLPHSMVWVLKMGDKSLTANWEGQFVASVNPIQELLSLSVFQFMPSFSGEGIKCLQQAKLSKVLANDIVENLEQFEVSRQLRCDICLQNVIGMYLYKQNGEQNEGCLILNISEKPQFFQRWLHTSAEDKNKWRQRSNFLTKTNRAAELIWIGGLVSELNELVAMILASYPDLEPVYKLGISQPFELKQDIKQVNGGEAEVNFENNLCNRNSGYHGYRFQKQKRPCRKLGSNVIKLRAEIIEVLKSHSIINANTDNVSSNMTDLREEGCADMSLGINLDEKICSCFKDYVNYCCDSAVELNTTLQQKVNPRSHGYYDNDFDMTLVPGGNIDDLTVSELISSKCSELVYYSFCAKQIGQIGFERHCSACRKCRTMQFWHCFACERCSESRQVCEFCGHLKDDSSRCVVKPLSVFKSQVATGKISLDDVKSEWLSSLNLPCNDIICIDPPKVDGTIRDKMDYNSTNAMVDQLGLLNPVGFLLGQPLIGASRKYRRYKVGPSNDRLSQNKSSEQSAGSSCSLQ